MTNFIVNNYLIQNNEKERPASLQRNDAGMPALAGLFRFAQLTTN
jgi:hypothetical protein